MKIAVAGMGYVGVSIATLLSQNNEVIAYDISDKRVNEINNRISPFKDKEIEYFFKEKNLNLSATTDYKSSFENANYIIICTPTNYDDLKNSFDTSSVEDVIIKAKKINPNATIVIKSTIPVGYTEAIKKIYNIKDILFSPEFLREGYALYDNLYPTRIIIGGKCKNAESFANLLKEGCIKKDVTIKYMSSTEAEAVKLFANSYLALRIAFFNELDTYSEIKKLNTKNIIEGVCLDPRIGNYYNNPSFGYGGYCLPKDTKQLLVNYENVPQTIIKSIVDSNKVRKNYISEKIKQNCPKTVGIYKLTMKKDSDNYRNSAIKDIIISLKNDNIKVIIYEPTIKDKTFDGCIINNKLDDFANQSDIIIANRFDKELEKYKKKVYTRDIYNRD